MNVFRHQSDMMDVGADRDDFGVTVIYGLTTYRDLELLANGDSHLDATRA